MFDWAKSPEVTMPPIATAVLPAFVSKIAWDTLVLPTRAGCQRKDSYLRATALQ